MIHVLHVIDSLGLGGAQTTLINFARFRNRTKFDLTVAPMHGRGVFAEPLEKEGVRILPMSAHKWPPGYLWNLPIALLKERFDITHFHLFGSNWIAKPIAALCGLSVRINHEQCNDPARMRSILTSTVDRLTNRLSSHVFAVSASTRDYLLQNNVIPESRISFLPNCVDTGFFAPANEQTRLSARLELRLPTNKLVVVGLGRLHPQKNWPLFLKVASRFPGSQFVIAGTGPEEERLRQLIAEANLGNVRLLGFRDTRTVLAAADVFLLTSDYEGTPMILLEAMSCGLPSVVSHVDGCADLLGDQLGGSTAAVGSEEDFVAKLSPYLLSKEMRSARGAAARGKVVSSYDARTQTRTIEDLYHRLLAG